MSVSDQNCHGFDVGDMVKLCIKILNIFAEDNLTTIGALLTPSQTKGIECRGWNTSVRFAPNQNGNSRARNSDIAEQCTVFLHPVKKRCVSCLAERSG